MTGQDQFVSSWLVLDFKNTIVILVYLNFTFTKHEDNRMPTTVFLHGHGNWAPSMGYTTVPKGCTISFYTHFAKLLNGSMVEQILDNNYIGELERTIGPFGTVPNLRLSSLTQAQRDWAIQKADASGLLLVTLPAAPPNHRMSLEELMAWCVENIGSELDFRWLCCQSLSLTQTGGRALGLNASDRTVQEGHRGEYLLRWKENGVEKTKWVRSESSIHR